MSSVEAEKFYDEILGNNDIPTKFKAIEAEKRLIETDSKLGEQRKQVEIKKAELDSISKLIDYYDVKIEVLKIFTIMILGFGLLLTVAGFYFWYIKI